MVTAQDFEIEKFDNGEQRGFIVEVAGDEVFFDTEEEAEAFINETVERMNSER